MCALTQRPLGEQDLDGYWTIWRSGLDLFHVIECDDYPRLLAELADLPVNVAWQARMADLLDVVHDYADAGAGLPVAWELPPTA